MAGITRDFDGDLRTGIPDMGADELSSGAARLQAASAAAGSLQVAAYSNPVPAGNSLQVSLATVEHAQVRLQLTDVLGCMVVNVVKQLASGASVQILDVSQLSKGMYVLSVVICSEQHTLKVVKE